ncbi:MAG TPA: serine hydrolase domain-containing protein [Woeseiaceae bacterium]|nr:serine hydrolase domain-containing protein [Woeseiaceae bacterium]
MTSLHAPIYLALLLAACHADVSQLTEPAASRSVVDPALRPIDAKIESELRRSGTPGAALVVVRDSRIVHARGYGLADVEAAQAADANTVWPIASITKVLTAIAAMQLVEAGKLSLDEEVATYVKRLRVPDEYDSPIIVADLLRHTSGLDELPGRRVDSAADIRPLRDFLSDHLVQYRSPGIFTSYSSYGMALAGLLVEEITGSSYADYVQSRIFRPLGMNDSRIMMRAGDDSGLAAPYEIDDGKSRRMDYEWYSTPPVASAVSSAIDMGHLLIGLTEATILSRATLRAMMTTQATLHPDVPGWGYGFQLDSVNGRGVAEHGGDIGGFASLLVIVPEESLGFFIIHHGEGSSLRFAVRELLLDQLLPGQAVAPVALHGMDLAPYAGSYRASFDCHTCTNRPTVPEFDVTVDDGALQLWGHRWVPIGTDLFAREDGRARLAFVREDRGHITALTGGSWRVGERIMPGEPSR